MHKFLLAYALLFTSFIFQPEYSYKIHDLRQLYEKSSKDKAICEKLIKHLNNYKGQDPVVRGFRAGTHGMMAKYAWSPYYKIKNLRTSALLFEDIISKNPQVAEVRFLRYSLEYFIPRYLNMSSHLDEDKKVFLDSLFRYPKSDIDGEVYQIMRTFLLRHPDQLTQKEKKQIQNLKT